MDDAAGAILIVDDHPESRLVLRAYLEHHGRRVYEAPDGEACLTLARETRPDLIVLDLLLPVLDGWRTAEALRRDPTTEGIPILALTATSRPEQHERALRAGCDVVVTKPVRPAVLLSQIEALLARTA